MAYINNISFQDEIKGRECSEYIREFCPERLLIVNNGLIEEEQKTKKDDDFQYVP